MKLITILSVIVLICSSVFGQNDAMFPVTVNEKIPAWSFTNDQGIEINSGDFAGKKVMLIFIRGRLTENLWCPICQYQYLEMAEMEQKAGLRDKHNMEIFFILPYSTDSLESWVDAFPKSIQMIEGWKHPKKEESLPQATKEWMVYSRDFFGKNFTSSAENPELSLPVLFDPEQKISKGLDIFREEWGGTKVPQNVPTVFIIDEEGVVIFKYYSQYTHDRVNAAYLQKYLENMMD